MKKNRFYSFIVWLFSLLVLFNCIIVTTTAGSSEFEFQAIVFETDLSNGKVLVVQNDTILKNPKEGQGVYFGGFSQNPYLWITISSFTKDVDGTKYDIKKLNQGNIIKFKATGMVEESSPPQYSLSKILNISVVEQTSNKAGGDIFKGFKILDFDSVNSFLKVSNDEKSDVPSYLLKYNGNINSLTKNDIINVKLIGPLVEINDLKLCYGTAIAISKRGDGADTILRSYDSVVISKIDIDKSIFVVTYPKYPDPKAPYMQFNFTKDTVVAIHDGNAVSASAPSVMSIDKLEIGKTVRVLAKGIDIKTQPFTSEAVQIDVMAERKIAIDKNKITNADSNTDKGDSSTENKNVSGGTIGDSSGSSSDTLGNSMKENKENDSDNDDINTMKKVMIGAFVGLFGILVAMLIKLRS